MHCPGEIAPYGDHVTTCTRARGAGTSAHRGNGLDRAPVPLPAQMARQAPAPARSLLLNHTHCQVFGVWRGGTGRGRRRGSPSVDLCGLPGRGQLGRPCWGPRINHMAEVDASRPREDSVIELLSDSDAEEQAPQVRDLSGGRGGGVGWGNARQAGEPGTGWLSRRADRARPRNLAACSAEGKPARRGVGQRG